MRIFYATDTTPNSALKSDIWRNNLYLPLVDLGNDVVEFQYDLSETFRHVDTLNPAHKAFIKTNRPKVTAELLRQIKATHAIKPINLFFGYLYDACILPEAIDEIRALGIITVNWFCNGSYQLYLVEEISPHFDWCLVPEKFRLPDYVAMGAHPLYCQEAANPKIYHPYDVSPEFDVTFVGQAYGERPAYITYLRQSGIDVRAWGPGWQNLSQAALDEQKRQRLAQRVRKLFSRQALTVIKRRFEYLKESAQPQTNSITNATAILPSIIDLPPESLGPPLSDTEMIQMYSRSKINLGFSTCGDTHLQRDRIVQVRLRDFEVPMSGGFYMVEYMEELEEFYEIGKEIVCYTDPKDLSDKIAYYLAHDDERERIRQAGHARCLRDHTWHQRFITAFAEMGLS